MGIPRAGLRVRRLGFNILQLSVRSEQRVQRFNSQIRHRRIRRGRQEFNPKPLARDSIEVLDPWPSQHPGDLDSLKRIEPRSDGILLQMFLDGFFDIDVFLGIAGLVDVFDKRTPFFAAGDNLLDFQRQTVW